MENATCTNRLSESFQIIPIRLIHLMMILSPSSLESNRPYWNEKEFHLSRSFKVSSRQIISAWSPLATGIMSKLWRHPVHAERVYVREILSRVLLESINPSVDICTENWIRYGESWPEISSIERLRAEKHVESFLPVVRVLEKAPT